MSLSPVPHDVAQAGLRALKTICAVSKGIEPLEARFLDGVQRYLLGTDFDVDALAPIDGAELARLVPPGEFRERIVGGMVIASCIDGDVGRDEMAVVERLANALDVDSEVLRAGRHLAGEQLFLARIDIARRALPGYSAEKILRQEGLPALIKQILPVLGIPNEATAARYRALGAYGEGTLGRGYHDFIVANRFSFPGEKYAGPEAIVLHDTLHVLGDYGTSPEEEVQVAAFQAACHHANQFHTLLFAIAQFHLGISLAPVSSPERLKVDPALMMKAVARGAKVNRDMWADFAPWEHFSRNIDDVRRELGIDPR